MLWPLCEDCDLDEAVLSCSICSMDLCDVCADNHECGDLDALTHEEELAKLAAWNARATLPAMRPASAPAAE